MPVEFQEHYLSEVQNMASEEKLEQVLSSMKENKVAIIGMSALLPMCHLKSNEQMFIKLPSVCTNTLTPPELPPGSWPFVPSSWEHRN